MKNIVSSFFDVYKSRVFFDILYPWLGLHLRVRAYISPQKKYADLDSTHQELHFLSSYASELAKLNSKKVRARRSLSHTHPTYHQKRTKLYREFLYIWNLYTLQCIIEIWSIFAIEICTLKSIADGWRQNSFLLVAHNAGVRRHT